MKASLTIQARINQSEILPKQGSVEEMVAFSKLKKVLVGFATAQLTSYRIVEVNGKLYTGTPDQITTIEITDDVVLVYAKYLKRISEYGQIHIEEADFCQAIIDEAERLQPEPNAPIEPEEPETVTVSDGE